MMPAILIICFLLFTVYAGLILYYRRGWQSIPPVDPAPEPSARSPFISVIIPARNEQDNIEACLQSVLDQRYPADKFEVIVVDDHSTDHTADLVLGLKKANLRLIDLSSYVSGAHNSYKKKAIETGIAQAKGELIVTTDADCRVGTGWLSAISGFYETRQPMFIAAPVKIESGSSFLGLFQSLDFLSLQGITGAAVHSRLHMMCNGANLAYPKKAFEEVNGFTGIDHIASGDDMLLMQKIHERHPGRAMFLPARSAIVSTAAEKSLGSFLNQRIRWASKSGQYSDRKIFLVLLLVYCFNCMLLALPILAVLSPSALTVPVLNYTIRIGYLGSWAALLGLKTLLELYFLVPVARFFGMGHQLIFFPLLQPFHILYTVIAGFLGRFGSYRWKGRKVK